MIWTFQSCPTTSRREGECIRPLRDASSSTTQHLDCGDRCHHWFYWCHWCCSGLSVGACRRDFTQKEVFFNQTACELGRINNTDGYNSTGLKIWFDFPFILFYISEQKPSSRRQFLPKKKKKKTGRESLETQCGTSLDSQIHSWGDLELQEKTDKSSNFSLSVLTKEVKVPWSGYVHLYVTCFL